MFSHNLDTYFDLRGDWAGSGWHRNPLKYHVNTCLCQLWIQGWVTVKFVAENWRHGMMDIIPYAYMHTYSHTLVHAINTYMLIQNTFSAAIELIQNITLFPMLITESMCHDYKCITDFKKEKMHKSDLFDIYATFGLTHWDRVMYISVCILAHHWVK